MKQSNFRREPRPDFSLRARLCDPDCCCTAAVRLPRSVSPVQNVGRNSRILETSAFSARPEFSVATPGWDNTFVDIIASPSREEAKKNWDAMMADLDFQALIKSEQANKLVEKVDSTYMRPTDFSPMK